jgi:hypothetical protein
MTPVWLCMTCALLMQNFRFYWVSLLIVQEVLSNPQLVFGDFLPVKAHIFTKIAHILSCIDLEENWIWFAPLLVPLLRLQGYYCSPHLTLRRNGVLQRKQSFHGTLATDSLFPKHQVCARSSFEWHMMHSDTLVSISRTIISDGRISGLICVPTLSRNIYQVALSVRKICEQQCLTSLQHQRRTHLFWEHGRPMNF